MATEQLPEQLHQDQLPTVVKEEPLEEEPEISTFCYETVTKEEVIIEDQLEHSDDQSDSSSGPPTEFSDSDSNSYHFRAEKDPLLKKDSLFEAAKDPPKKAHAKDRKSIGISTGIVTDENGLFKCPECDRTQQSRKAAVKCMKRHLARRLGLFQCKICLKRSGTAADLRNHEHRHKQKAEKPAKAVEISKELPFKCSECKRTFAKERQLKRCLRRHDAIKAKLYKCKCCKKCWPTKHELEKHVESTHRKRTISLHFVEDVLESEEEPQDQVDNANRPASISGHLAAISKERPFQCSVCKRAFDKVSLLNKCKRKHKAIKAELYKCKHCGKCWPTNHELVRHVGSMHKKETTPPEKEHRSSGSIEKHKRARSRTQHKPNTEQLQAIESASSEPDQQDKAPSIVVKEEPPEQPETVAFCYETVTKEEVIIEDEMFERLS